ncbi:hypothetical protein GW17_00006453 [Ensete ventricosum]|nr:hypothetical protein GW17_00006453 [Ensete ventricosum]RZS04536.1 hypothetical protein BHM03_00034881 [Ensete ventricosum]
MVDRPWKWLTVVFVCADHRYLRRGVDDKGRVANDVETEQIVFCGQPDEIPREITSVVQNRGSIPLFWSQEARRLGFKPDIICKLQRAVHSGDSDRSLTTCSSSSSSSLLLLLYENPIIVLSMIKTASSSPQRRQKGVLRTNCIDCLDRTNVAQIAYGLTALGHQLHALGIKDVPEVDLEDQLAADLMNFYREMGDKLALQYVGSAAHDKVFPLAEFLGLLVPQQDKPELCDLDSDQQHDVGR